MGLVNIASWGIQTISFGSLLNELSTRFLSVNSAQVASQLLLKVSKLVCFLVLVIRNLCLKLGSLSLLLGQSLGLNPVSFLLGQSLGLKTLSF